MRNLPNNTSYTSFRDNLKQEFDDYLKLQKKRFNPNNCLKVDLHCHDLNSDIPDELWGRILRLPETWLKTKKLVKLLKKNDCDVVTITNHNNARSCWDLIKKGETTTLTITGLGLSSALNLPSSLVVNKIISQNTNRIVVNVTAKDNAPIGYVDIQLGESILTKQLAIYKQVNALAVVPSYGVSRVGGNGGSTPKTNALFRAVGTDYGKDGIANTKDDINLGYIEDVTWAVVPRDEIAKKDEDVKFAGQMNSNTGEFSPAAAGPNPERYRSTNNAGNLNVVAKLTENGHEISGIGRLLVTLQRWNNPPLK